MPSPLATAYMVIRGDSSKLSGDFAKIREMAKSQLAGVPGMLAGAAKISLGVIGAGAVLGTFQHATQFLAESVQVAREARQANTRLAAVLIETGNAAGYGYQQMKTMARELASATNFGVISITNAMARLSALGNIGGDVFRRTITGAADLAAIMGVDLEGTTARLGRVMADPIRGLDRLGRTTGGLIRLTQAEREHIDAMVTAGNIAKAEADAQELILSKLAKFRGTAEALQDPLTTMEKSWQGVKRDVGQIITPATNALAGFVSLYAKGISGLAGIAGASELAEEKLRKLQEEASRGVEVPVDNAIAGLRMLQEDFEAIVKELKTEAAEANMTRGQRAVFEAREKAKERYREGEKEAMDKAGANVSEHWFDRVAQMREAVRVLYSDKYSQLSALAETSVAEKNAKTARYYGTLRNAVEDQWQSRLIDNSERTAAYTKLAEGQRREEEWNVRDAWKEVFRDHSGRNLGVDEVRAFVRGAAKKEYESKAPKPEDVVKNSGIIEAAQKLDMAAQHIRFEGFTNYAEQIQQAIGRPNGRDPALDTASNTSSLLGEAKVHTKLLHAMSTGKGGGAFAGVR